jgi:hypothetical protein
LAKVKAKGNQRGRFREARRVPGALLLLLLLATLSIACGGNEGSNGGGGDAAPPATTVGGGGGKAEEPPITELSEIVSASDGAALAGRRVRISEADVVEVVNNHSLFVGAGEEDRLFVAVRRIPLFGETTGGLDEQRFEEGQTLKLIGRIRPVPETADEALRRFGLKGEEFELLQDEQIFIRAKRAEVVSGG